MSYRRCVSIALGSSQTGLTLTAQLVDTSGANVGGSVSSGFTEIGAGNYIWDYSAYPDGHRGAVVFKAGSTIKAILAINPEDFENGDAKVSSRLSTPQGVRKNAALANFIFTMYSSDQHVPMTGLSPVCRVTLDGGSETTATNSPATEVGNGRYRITLAAADLNGNVVAFRASSSGAEDTELTIITVQP